MRRCQAGSYRSLTRLLIAALAVAAGVPAAWCDARGAGPGRPREQLGVQPLTQSMVVLTWTAVGDDGHVGTASHYDIRYATEMITEQTWPQAIELSEEPPPREAGQEESFTVMGLSPATTYYFAMKVGDEVPNWSALSNVACLTTPPAPPEPGVHVEDMAVTRKRTGRNYWGRCVTWIVDSSDQPVRDALVELEFSGPTAGYCSGTTGEDGSVLLQSTKAKDPLGRWCFEVIAVSHPALGYDPQASHLVRACEDGLQQAAMEMNSGELRLADQASGLLPATRWLPVSFRLAQAGRVRLSVLDVQGRVRGRTIDETRPAGMHTVNLDLGAVASGIYFCQFETDELQTSRRFVLVK